MSDHRCERMPGAYQVKWWETGHHYFKGWALWAKFEDVRFEISTWPIHFCPWCGEKLPKEKPARGEPAG